MSEPEKKIIIDEDWKSQVQAEKEAAKHGAAPDEPPTEASAESDAYPDLPLPPPTLTSLVTMLVTQAMFALGMIPRQEGMPSAPRLHEAKHLIDAIALLEEKTEGNRTDEESQMFTSALHELRMSFLGMQNHGR